MFDKPPDLNQYRSVEELQRVKLDVRDEMARLERDWNGLPFNQEARDKFVGLKETSKKIDERLVELRSRARVLAEQAAGNRNALDRATVEPKPRQDDPWTPRHVVEGREAGLRAIDSQQDVLTAGAADRLDRLTRSNDPIGLEGRYLAAVANPHYNSAFGKLLMDPTTGHLRFTPAEVEAVRVTSAVEAERNLNVTTGSAGQFAIPFTIDPSIIMTGTGVVNPIRQLARVETINTTTWKGVRLMVWWRRSRPKVPPRPTPHPCSRSRRCSHRKRSRSCRSRSRSARTGRVSSRNCSGSLTTPRTCSSRRSSCLARARTSRAGS